MDCLHTLDGGSSLFGLGLQVCTRRLPGQQYNAVEAGDDDVRIVIQPWIGLGDVNANLGINQGVVDFAAEGARAAVIFNRCFTAGVNHRGAAADADEAQGQGQKA